MSERLVLVGSYTEEVGGKGRGISTYWLDEATGALTPGGVLDLAAPSWLEWHPALPVVYAANELGTGMVTAVAADDTGDLRVLGALPTGGADPCHLAVTPDGRHLLAANYTGGSVAVFALDDAGRLDRRTDLVQLSGSGPVASRQEAPHAHMVALSAGGELAGVVDLGADEIRTFRITADGTLEPSAVSALPPGSGPRQLVRSGSSAYVLAELGACLIALDETAPGRFTVAATVPASERDVRNLPAQLTVVGRFGYVSNRGPDTISAFDLGGAAPVRIGEYPIGTGWPRHFGVVGDYLIAGNQHADELVVFAVDAATGALSERHRYPAGTPVCIVAQPAG